VKYLLTPPGGSRPTLVVETCPRADEAAIAEFSAELYGLSCPNGLLFDENICIVLRDTFEDMKPTSIEVERELSTDAVLGRLGPSRGRSLEDRVEQWLAELSSNWDQALPEDPELAAPFITDIVPAVFGAIIHSIRASQDEARLR
jgi:hypothetical protein